MFESAWRVHEKLPDAFHEREFGRKFGGPPFPRKKIFRIGGDEISRCLEGLTCTLQSLLSWYSITFSIPPHHHYFYANLDKLAYTRPIFSKSAGYVPPDLLWLRQWSQDQPLWHTKRKMSNERPGQATQRGDRPSSSGIVNKDLSSRPRPRTWRQNRFRLRGAREHKTKKK